MYKPFNMSVSKNSPWYVAIRKNDHHWVANPIVYVNDAGRLKPSKFVSGMKT